MSNSGTALPGTAPRCPGLRVLADTDLRLHLTASGHKWCAGYGLLVASLCAALITITITILYKEAAQDPRGMLTFVVGTALALLCGLGGLHMVLWREHILVDAGGLRRYCTGLIRTGRGEILRGLGQLLRYDPDRHAHGNPMWATLVHFCQSVDHTDTVEKHYLVAEGPADSFKVGVGLNAAAVDWLARRTATIWRRAELGGGEGGAEYAARELR